MQGLLNFVIPAGATGPTGPTGPAGALSAALAYQLGTLRSQSNGGGLALSTLQADPEDGYSLGVDHVVIHSAGTYLLRYTVFVPEAAAIDTVLRLQANDQTLLSSVVRAVKGASCGHSATFSGQALIVAERETTVRVTSSSILNLTDSAANTAVSLSIDRVV